MAAVPDCVCSLCGAALGMQTAPQIERDIESVHAFLISLNLLDGYTFRADFDDASLEPLYTDEPKPLGSGSGPSSSRLLATALTNCLASSLLHCLRRSRVEIEHLSAKATVTVGRNKRGRLRIERIAVQLEPSVVAAQPSE